MKLSYKEISGWPPLAWFATCESGLVHVLHGPEVEVHGDWFVEGVWADDFSRGHFDRTDLFAGSGGRIRDGEIVFASSGNTVDRIVSSQSAGRLWVSNSLAALVACTGTEIDPTYPSYYEDFTTIINGLSRYKQKVSSSKGPIWLTYFGLITWDGRAVARGVKPFVRRELVNFASYRAFLSDTMGQIAENAQSANRRRPRELICTVSSGYDSPTVAVLAREAGCKHAICIDKDSSGEPEDGEEIARRLGLTPQVVDREAWRSLDMPEPPFLAADGTAEAIPLAAAKDHLRDTVLLTGYHGDKMWDKHTVNLSDEIVRGDASGLSLSEFRLHAGFINCPVPFWGVRQIRDVNSISKAPEMKKWDIPGDYSRPVCRRIVESAGVPRELFGQAKRVTAVAFKEFLTERTLDRYQEWLAENRSEWIRRGRMPPITSTAFEDVVRRCEGWFDRKVSKLPILWRLAFYEGLDRPGPLRRYAFAWALGMLRERYSCRDGISTSVSR